MPRALHVGIKTVDGEQLKVGAPFERPWNESRAYITKGVGEEGSVVRRSTADSLLGGRWGRRMVCTHTLGPAASMGTRFQEMAKENI